MPPDPSPEPVPARKPPRLAPESDAPREPEADPERRQFRLTRAKVDPLNVAGGTPIDVHTMLQENTARAQNAEPPPLPTLPRLSRRKRDFWIVTLGGLGFLGGIAAVLPHDPYILEFVGGIAAVFVGMAIWIMWFVMSDY